VTLIELLIVVVVITIMAGAVLGGLQKATQMAREARTKATIAKIDHFIGLKIESYKSRRVALNTQPCTAQSGQGTPVYLANGGTATAYVRLCAVRDLMRMEMPERVEDVTTPPLPITVTSGGQNLTMYVPEPSLHKLYALKGLSTTSTPIPMAKVLYLTVMTGNAEAREQFSQNEIGVDITDHMSYFIDGWGSPIVWLRWAPGCSASTFSVSTGALSVNTHSISDIQSGVPSKDHDPFDPRNVQPNACQLFPLIVSPGGHKVTVSGVSQDDYGVNIMMQGGSSNLVSLNPFDSYRFPDPFDYTKAIGARVSAIPIHNHHIEAR
jgi:hypothetical protein